MVCFFADRQNALIFNVRFPKHSEGPIVASEHEPVIDARPRPSVAIGVLKPEVDEEPERCCEVVSVTFQRIDARQLQGELRFED